MWFANGLAFTPEGDALLICETFMNRVRPLLLGVSVERPAHPSRQHHQILKFQLSGSSKGEVTVFLDGFPGPLDGMSRGPNGYWVAMPTRTSMIMNILNQSKALRSFVRK